MTHDAPSRRPQPQGPPPRVVVTGLGMRSPLGGSLEVSWRGLCSGRQGFAREGDEAEGFPASIGDPGADGSDQADITEGAAWSAWLNAGLATGGVDRDRLGVVFGLSKGDLPGLGRRLVALRRGGGDAEGLPGGDGRGAGWLRFWPGFGSGQVARRLDARGPCLAPVAACATGLVAVIQGADLIRRGVCDVVLAGAADASADAFLRAAFRRLGVLARVGPGDDPRRAVRPWDRARSGFLVGQGAAAFVLEREGHARARGAAPYVEFAGGALGADAYHATDQNPDPANLAGVIGRTLRWSGVEAAELDHVNVHGTATRSNDPLECRAIRRALGPHADAVSCSANKAQIGHCLGAAGALELAFTCLAVRDGFVPPTLNLDDPDPACDLDGTPHVGRPRAVRAALKLSIGFGGHIAAAVVRRAEAPRRDPRPGPP